MYCNSMSFSELGDICRKVMKETDRNPSVVFALADDEIEYLLNDEVVTTDAYKMWMYDEFCKRTDILKDSGDGRGFWSHVVTGSKDLVGPSITRIMDADVVIFERPWHHNPALRLFMTACNIYRIPYAVV